MARSLSRKHSSLVSLGIFVASVAVGASLNNLWLGLALGAFIGLVAFIGFESARGRNQGVNDPDKGLEL